MLTHLSDTVKYYDINDACLKTVHSLIHTLLTLYVKENVI